MTPTKSTFSEKPHSTQANCACFLRFSLEIGPHPGQAVLDKQCWTSSAGVLWWNRDEQAASPDHLVFHLPAKVSPLLVEDGLVESGFLLDVPAGLFDSAGGRSGHIAHLEILHHNHRVVLLMGVEVLCRKSRPRWQCGRECARPRLSPSSSSCSTSPYGSKPACAFSSWSSCSLKLLSASMNSPSDNVANRTTPMSMPAAEVEGWTGGATSRLVRIERDHLPAVCRTVTLLTSPEDLRAVAVANPAKLR